MDKKSLALMTALMTASNLGFLYCYRAIGISLADSVNLTAIMQLATPGTLVSVISASFFVSLSVFLILLFSAKLEKRERIVASMLSCLLPIPVMIWSYANQDAFLLMTMFYMGGLVVTAASTIKRNEGALDKIKSGWSAGKKVVYALAIGGMITGALFAVAYKSDYDNAAKQSIIAMATTSLGGMNFSGGAMSDIVRSSITRADVEELLSTQLGDYFNNMTDAQKDAVIDETYEQYIAYFSQSMNSQANSSALGNLQSKLSEGVLTQAIESVPIIKAFFDYLPLFVGFTILTTVLIFGEMLIVPMTSLLALALPTQKIDDKKMKEFSPSVEKFAGLPFDYQERKREEEREADKKEGI